MDPKKCLEDAQVALVEDRFDEAREHLSDYERWRADGGFEPKMRPLGGHLIGPEMGDGVYAEIVSFLPPCNYCGEQDCIFSSHRKTTRRPI